MLKLVNIKKTDSYIEADYIPEDSNSKGYVKLNVKDKTETLKRAPGFQGEYARMAFNGLKEILEDLEKNPDCTLPTERLVMWY